MPTVISIPDLVNILAAREGIVQELNHQLIQKEKQIEKLHEEIRILRESIRVSSRPKPLIRLGDY